MRRTEPLFDPSDPGDESLRRAQADPAWRRKHGLEPGWHYEAGGLAWKAEVDGPVEGITSRLLN